MNGVYDKQCRQFDPVTVAQEIDRDYSASVHGIVIPGAWVRAAIDARDKLQLPPSGHRGLALDVADEGTDKNALVGTHGFNIEYIDEWSGKGSDIFGAGFRRIATSTDSRASSTTLTGSGLTCEATPG